MVSALNDFCRKLAALRYLSVTAIAAWIVLVGGISNGQFNGALHAQDLVSKSKPNSTGKDLKAWDRNQDGLLQTAEIPPNLRPAMNAWAKKLDLNPNKPLPLAKLLKTKAKGKKALKDQTKSNNSKKSREKNQEKNQEEKKEENKEKKKVENRDRGVPPRRVAGFGEPNSRLPKAEATATNQAESKENEKQESAAARRQQRRLEWMAKSLMFQYDKNKSGQLERAEWAKLKGNPSASDANGDGILSREELVAHLGGYGKRERDVTRSAKSTNAMRAKKNKQGKSYRFLTPQERLPEGLPGWFVEKDYNQDGQISLSEYEPELTTAKVARFRRLDLNRDGFIVAQEYLKSTAASGD